MPAAFWKGRIDQKSDSNTRMVIPVMQVDDVDFGAGSESEDAGQGSVVKEKVAVSRREGGR